MSDRNRRARRPGLALEPLEGRVVLSTAHLGAAVSPAALVHGAGYLFLNGTAHGTAKSSPGLPDAGTTVSIHAQGKVSPLGVVHVSGTLHGTGFIQSGHAGGTITLANRRGTVTLDLEGPSQPGFTAPPSGTYQFHFAKGTGAYAKDLADGTVDVTFKNGGVTLAFHGAPNRY